MRFPGKMTTDDEAILDKICPALKAAVTWSNSNIALKQETALKHYKREALPGDDKLRGKSRWISPKIQQHTDWLSGQLIRILDSADQVVEFCGIGPEDEAIAKQQNIAVNWILKTKNSHGAYLQPWIQNGLLTGLGVVTAEFEVEEEESLPRLLKGVPNELLVALNQQEEARQIIIEQVGKAQTIPGPMGIIEVRDLKIRTIRRIPKFQILPVAPEDFIVSKDAKFSAETGGIEAKVQGHRKLMSRGDLLEAGFDREKVDALPKASDSTAGMALERSKELAGEQGVGPDDVEVFTIYTKMKLGKDTKARHYRLAIGGDLENRPVLLDHAEVSRFYPYSGWCPFPIANTLFGLGIGDRLADDHVLQTRMMRAVLDSLSQSVNPIKIVNPDTTNVEDLLNSHAGAIVRSSDPTGGISYNKPLFAGADAIPVLDMLGREIEYSTGTGPTMIGIDAADFQRTSATAASLRSNASQLLIEMISRFFAETGYRYLVKIVVDQLISKPDEAAELFQRLTNQAIPLDHFSTDFDLATSVAFGVMSRDQSTAQLSNILAQQMNAIQAGLPVANAQNVYETLSKMAETAGFKNTGLLFTDPSTLPPPPPPAPPVDPNAGLIEIEKVKAQLKAQSDEADRQFQMSKLAAEMDLRRDQMAQDFELKRAEITAKYAASVEIERLKLEQSAPRDPMGNIAI